MTENAFRLDAIELFRLDDFEKYDFKTIDWCAKGKKKDIFFSASRRKKFISSRRKTFLKIISVYSNYFFSSIFYSAENNDNKKAPFRKRRLDYSLLTQKKQLELKL